MRIGVDMDDVIADFTGAWLAAYNDQFAITEADDLKREDITAWDVTQFTHFNSHEEWMHWIRSCVPGLYRNLSPLGGALEALDALIADGHDIVILTSKPEWAKWDTFNWLANQIVPTSEVHITHDKASVKCDVYIDDGPHNLEAIRDRSGGVAVRWVTPWNRPMDGVWDAGSWAEFRDIVNVMEMEREKYPQIQLVDPSESVSEYIVRSTNEQIVTNALTGGQKGVKLARFDLLPIGPLTQIAEHYGKGAQKYEDRNWERGYDWSLSYGALMRHATQFWGGQTYDEETGSHHMAAVAFHAMALMQFTESHPELDNRPTS